MNPAAHRHVRAPDVDGDRAPGVEAVHELRRRVDELRLAAGVAVVGDLVGEVPRQHARVGPGLHARRGARGAAPGGAGRASCAVHAPGESTGPMPCQTRMPGRVEALEQRRVERVLARVAFAPIACSRRDDRVHVVRAQRVAAPSASSWIDAPRRTSGRAVEQQAPARQRSSRSPTFDRQPDSPGTASRSVCSAGWPGAQRFGRGDVARCARTRRRAARCRA